VLSAKELGAAKDGQVVQVAGLVLVRQRPETAKGVCFMTLEDETGFANLVIFNNLFDLYRKEILGAKLMMAEGKLQVEGEVIHVVVSRCYDLSKLLRGLRPTNNEDPPLLTLARPDIQALSPTPHKQTGIKKSGQEKVFPESRNFK
jgi:error-prone DNA polymerase